MVRTSRQQFGFMRVVIKKKMNKFVSIITYLHAASHVLGHRKNTSSNCVELREAPHIVQLVPQYISHPYIGFIGLRYEISSTQFKGKGDGLGLLLGTTVEASCTVGDGVKIELGDLVTSVTGVEEGYILGEEIDIAFGKTLGDA